MGIDYFNTSKKVNIHLQVNLQDSKGPQSSVWEILIYLYN